MATIFDNRQSRQRSVLDSLSNATNLRLDVLLNLINDELQPSLRMSQSSPIDRVVNIGAMAIQTLDGSEGHKRYHIPGVTSASDVTFAGATVTFPAANGGNITTSAGSFTLALSCPSGEYVKVLIYFMDGEIRFAQGTSNVSSAAATIPAVPSTVTTGGIYALGYVLIHNTGGSIDSIDGNAIYQFSSDQLRLQDATATVPGLVTIGSQTFGGDKTFNDDLLVNGDTTLGNASGDAVTINASTVATPNGLNFDSNTLVIDAANNRVGIDTAAPTEALEVTGNAKVSGTITTGGSTVATQTFATNEAIKYSIVFG